MPALDYSRLAGLYDRYCVFDGDLQFWRSQASGVAGDALELMAGTGRVTLPLVEQGARLVCVDSDLPMLRRLREKLARRRLRASLLAGDVTRLPVRRRFSRILLPFQGLSELRTREDRLSMLRSVARCLADSGRFICTGHDPVSRRRPLDGNWHEIGTFADGEGGSLRLSLRGEWREDEELVTGEQEVLQRTSGGSTLQRIRVPLRFSLPSLAEIRELARRAGLRVVEVQGDYAGGAYRPGESPCIIAMMQRDG